MADVCVFRLPSPGGMSVRCRHIRSRSLENKFNSIYIRGSLKAFQIYHPNDMPSDLPSPPPNPKFSQQFINIFLSQLFEKIKTNFSIRRGISDPFFTCFPYLISHFHSLCQPKLFHETIFIQNYFGCRLMLSDLLTRTKQ